MKNHDAGTDEFIQQFNDFPHHRQNIIANFIKGHNRLLLNIPGGPARLISARLRGGPFSAFYEYEKGLARALHPFLAGLNLNVVADILINSLFSEKYHFYARDINYILALNKKLEPDALKSVILKMVERDGHNMVVKFYDLVLRLIDADLYRELKPAELFLIEMKRNLVDNAAESSAAIVNMYDAYRKTHGDSAARLLCRRVQWDQVLKDYLQTEDEPAFTGISDDAAGAASEDETGATSSNKQSGPRTGLHEAAGEPVDEVSWHDRVTRYAALIKENYLIKKEPLDEQGIRKIVEGLAVKNEMVSGTERAADIVREVLGLWIEDDTLDEGMRDILTNIRDERQGLPVQQDEIAPEEPMQKELAQEEFQPETLPMLESEPEADDAAGADTGAVGDEKVTETSRAEDESESVEAGISEEEMSAILEGIPDNTPENDEQSATPVGREAQERGDDESFLINEDESHEMAEGNTDDSFLIDEDEKETADEVPDEAPEKVSEDQDFIGEMIAADEFVIQDEVLFEDKSLKKKQKAGKKPDDE